MKKITFSIQKGGTGKTSISVSVAVELAKNNKVLFIDADPQGNATTWFAFDSVKYEFSDLINDVVNDDNKLSPKDVLLKTQIENLFFIPTAGVGGGLSNIKDTIAGQAPFFIADILSMYEDVFDYCIIDTSPSFGVFEKMLFIASDEVIPVLHLDNFSTDGIEIFFYNLSNLKKSYRLGDNPKFNKIVLNGLNNTKKLDKKFLAYFMEKFDTTELFVIPTDPIFGKAQATNHFIQDFQDTKKETKENIYLLASKI